MDVDPPKKRIYYGSLEDVERARIEAGINVGVEVNYLIPFNKFTNINYTFIYFNFNKNLWKMGRWISILEFGLFFFFLFYLLNYTITLI